MTRLVPVLVLLLAGCDLYFTNGDDDDDICALAELDPPAQQVLDPNTGVCTFIPNDSDCRPCEPCAEPAVWLDWAACPGPCDALAEDACLDTPLCRAAYSGGAFAACWSIAPSGPEPGSCAGLDAYECSRHDNCAAYFTGLGGPSPRFDACRTEPGGSLCDGVTCQVGSHCEEQCYPCDGRDCPPVCQAYCVAD